MQNLESKKIEKESLLTKEEYAAIVSVARELARETKRFINKNTAIIYLDKSGRFARMPYEEALKEQGAKLPKTRYFVNFSSRDQPLKMPRTKQNELTNFFRQNIHKIGLENISNFVVVDTAAMSGRTLKYVKESLRNLTGRNVTTVSFSGNLSGGLVDLLHHHPNYFSANPTVDGFMKYSIWTTPKPVKDIKTKHTSAIVRTEPDKRGIPFFLEYNKNIKDEFARSHSWGFSPYSPKTPLSERIKKRFKKH